ncbi:MAG: hypothetical protein JSW17_04625 [Candidatus Omnitrophota bacterium]|nr:MAG: hypothetical protein JSW17_04625 [Candidatus Omnitrophota bacterium]
MKSPLLFPVTLKDNKIIVLDETQIPFKEEYIEVSSLDKVLGLLKEMKTRSLGQVLLFFYSCVLFEGRHSIDEISKQFKMNRPTFDFSMLSQILKSQIKKDVPLKEIVNKFISGFDLMRRKRARELAISLPHNASILTICNVNGELIYLYEELKELGKQALFYVCETRPYLQGTRLSFWELRKNNIPTRLVCDNQVATLMKEGVVNCVITGADRATTKCDVINKVGTYSLARLAKHFDIPFYPLTQYPRDIDVDSIEIEERPSQESFMYLEGDYSGTEAFYPAFDITKHEFITECIELKP